MRPRSRARAACAPRMRTRDERFAGLDRRVRILGAQAARALDRGRIHALGA